MAYKNNRVWRLTRRGLLLLGGSTALSPIAAFAQRSQPARIGWIAISPAAEIAEFRDAMRVLGHLEGKTYVIEERHAGGERARLPALIQELLRLEVDAIVARGVVASQAVANATRSVPVVVVTGGPFATGAIGTLARPGGNVTGVHILAPELAAKRLELAKHALPALARAAVLTAIDTPEQFAATLAAGPALGISLIDAPLRDAADLDAVFRRVVELKAGAMIVPASLVLRVHSAGIARLAQRHRIPTIGADRTAAGAGFLLSYGPDLVDVMRRAAAQVDLVLKGKKPADIPVEQAVTINLVVNLKTASALGITIPPTVLARADEVIE